MRRWGASVAVSRWSVLVSRKFHAFFVVLVAMAAGLAGCSNPHHLLLEESVREQGRSVTMTQLEDSSVSPPVTLEQAQRDDQAKPLQRAAPILEMDLTVAEVRKAALENNLDIRVQLVSPAVAGERVSEEEARFENSFKGSVSRRSEDLLDVVAEGLGPKPILPRANLHWRCRCVREALPMSVLVATPWSWAFLESIPRTVPQLVFL